MVILKIKNSLNALQAQLNFEDWDKAAYPQFATNKVRNIAWNIIVRMSFFSSCLINFNYRVWEELA